MPSSISCNWISNPRPPKLFLLSTNQYAHWLETLELLFTHLMSSDDDGSDLIFKDGTWFASKNWFDQQYAKDIEAKDVEAKFYWSTRVAGFLKGLGCLSFGNNHRFISIPNVSEQDPPLIKYSLPFVFYLFPITRCLTLWKTEYLESCLKGGLAATHVQQPLHKRCLNFVASRIDSFFSWKRP